MAEKFYVSSYGSNLVPKVPYPPATSHRTPFSFKSLFSSINTHINTLPPSTTPASQLLHLVKTDLKQTRAYPLLKAVKGKMKSKYARNKQVGKVIKGLSRHFKQVSKDAGGRCSQQEIANVVGGLILATSKLGSTPHDHTPTDHTQTHADKKKKRKKECAECQDDIEGDYYVCSECTNYFLCKDCEEESQHHHLFYKIKGDRIAQDHSLETKPCITNFPVPENLGMNCADGKSFNCCFSSDDLMKLIPEYKPEKKYDEIRSIKKRRLRPGVIQAPEHPLIGSPGTYVIADFTIQNQSVHNLPKLLFLKKVSIDPVEFETIKDTDALEGGKSKVVSLPLEIPYKKGTYKCVFSYFNKSWKKMGDDLIVTVISQ